MQKNAKRKISVECCTDNAPKTPRFNTSISFSEIAKGHKLNGVIDHDFIMIKHQ